MPSRQTDLLLVVPPFATASYPPLGPSVLLGKCQQLGISSSILYANLEFAAAVGWRLCESISGAWRPYLVGEGVFAPHAFPCGPDPESFLFDDEGPTMSTCLGAPVPPLLERKSFETCRKHAEAFLDLIVQRILSTKPRIVGFSSTFQQTTASFAVARRLKEAHGDTLIVLGGFNTRLPMGRALADMADAIDCVFCGEADLVFPEFCGQYLSGSLTCIPELIDCGRPRELDAVATPDYDDYFEQLGRFQASGQLPKEWPERLNFESSRACWWNRCKFCSINGTKTPHRHKSPQRVAEEIRHLSNHYAVYQLDATDTIMPRGLDRECLPSLAEGNPAVRLLYEVKSGQEPEWLNTLVRAGVSTIQPGIESLSTNVLNQIDKGVNAFDNIRLLRDALSRKILVIWNFLIGIPGERRADYEEISELLPSLIHLQPPMTWGTIKIERYSRYRMMARDFGIRNVRPLGIYRHLYPKDACVNDLAYRFDAEWHTELLDNEELLSRVTGLVDEWIATWGESDSIPQLIQIPLKDGSSLIRDTRPCAKEELFFATPQQMQVLSHLEYPAPISIAVATHGSMVEELHWRGFVVKHEGRFLSVVVDPMAADGRKRQTYGLGSYTKTHRRGFRDGQSLAKPVSFLQNDLFNPSTDSKEGTS